MIHQTNQPAERIIRVVAFNSQLTVLVTVRSKRRFDWRQFVGEKRSKTSMSATESPSYRRKRVDEPRRPGPEIVGIVIHEVTRRIHEGGHLRTVARCVVLVIERDGWPADGFDSVVLVIWPAAL